MTNSPDRIYKYADVPLTPTVIADLAKYLIRAPTFRRADLIEAVLEYHGANGGLPGKSDIKHSSKKALGVLARDGLVTVTGAQGLWRWVVTPEPNGPADPELEADEDADELQLTNQTVVEGEGTGSVYVYYFPSYKHLADLRHEDRWPMKIGMTAVSHARIRISQQIVTAMPEEPVVAYVRKVNTPLRLERCIQSLLFYKGQQIDDAPGSEWFYSNPDEVRALVQSIMSPLPHSD